MEPWPGDRVLRRQPLVQDAGNDADVNHVRQLLAQSVALDLGLGELGERHRVVGDVRASLGGREGLFVHHHPAGADRPQVLVPGGDVEGDQDVDLVPAGHVPLRGDPKLVPGWQALDVGRKYVLGRHRDTHVEDRPGEDQVRCLAPRAVDGGGLDCEVVDDLVGHFVRDVNFTRTHRQNSCGSTNELVTFLSL